MQPPCLQKLCDLSLAKVMEVSGINEMNPVRYCKVMCNAILCSLRMTMSSATYPVGPHAITSGERMIIACTPCSPLGSIQYLPTLQLSSRQHASTIQHNVSTVDVASSP